MSEDIDTRVICVSHLKDVDGCVCAALLKCARNSKVLLTNYGNVNNCFKTIQRNYEMVFICDLGLNENNLDEIRRIRQFAKVTYIDHHQLDNNMLLKLQDANVDIIHDSRDCATVLTYNLFKDLLPREAGLLASYAAISDRLEDGPKAKAIIKKYDRDFVLFETMLLTYAIEHANINIKKKMIADLSKLKYPHEITDVPRYALKEANKISSLRKELPAQASKLKNITYVQTQNKSLGVIANLLLDVCEANVGVCYNVDLQKRFSDLSIRGRPIVLINLGVITSKIAKSLGGFGGGHPLASGARIPAHTVDTFLEVLDDQIEIRHDV